MKTADTALQEAPGLGDSANGFSAAAIFCRAERGPNETARCPWPDLPLPRGRRLGFLSLFLLETDSPTPQPILSLLLPAPNPKFPPHPHLAADSILSQTLDFLLCFALDCLWGLRYVIWPLSCLHYLLCKIGPPELYTRAGFVDCGRPVGVCLVEHKLRPVQCQAPTMVADAHVS